LEQRLLNQSGLDYLTADLYSPKAMLRMDITKIQFEDNHFDVIICNHVLEHIVDDRAVRELYRVLRPGGWAILQVPLSLTLQETYEDFSVVGPDARERAFGQFDHVRIYARDYQRRLEQVGFAVEVFAWTSDSREFGGSRARFGLNREEDVFVARKRI